MRHTSPQLDLFDYEYNVKLAKHKTHLGYSVRDCTISRSRNIVLDEAELRVEGRCEAGVAGHGEVGQEHGDCVAHRISSSTVLHNRLCTKRTLVHEAVGVCHNVRLLFELAGNRERCRAVYRDVWVIMFQNGCRCCPVLPTVKQVSANVAYSAPTAPTATPGVGVAHAGPEMIDAYLT